MAWHRFVIQGRCGCKGKESVNIRRKAVKLIQLLGSGLYRSALSKGVAAGIEHEGILRLLDCKHVVDIGANCGQFALVSRACFPAARIDSFEPLAEPAERYQSVLAHDKKAFLHRMAIGDLEGESAIHVSSKIDSSSLLPITDEQTDLFPGTEESHTRTIRVAPITTVLQADDIVSPALLKLDVQGYELAALRGCEVVLRSFSYVYCECSFVELYAGQAMAYEVIAYLQEHGFVLQGVYNMSYRGGRAIQADFFFVNRSAQG